MKALNSLPYITKTGDVVPFGHYTKAMLDREAKLAAQSHAKDNGGGRPFGIEWEIVPGRMCVSLIVSYHVNRPNGHCGLYRTNVAI